MRTLTAHQVNDQNRHLTITAAELPKGMVPNSYRIVISSLDQEAESITEVSRILQFQRGPIEEGINGNVTDEALLAILADRLEHRTDEGYQESHNIAVYLRTLIDKFKRRAEQR